MELASGPGPSDPSGTEGPSSATGGSSAEAGAPATAAPPSRYESQKRRDWNTFLQYLKNHRPPLTLGRCSGAHVIEFLKYLDQFGKTKVHVAGCPYFGHPNPPAPCACPLKQAWGSLDALIGRLRAAYEENGGRPESNPFGARAVRIYLKEVREGQAKARGIPYEKKKRKRVTAAAAVAVVSSGGGGSSSSQLVDVGGSSSSAAGDGGGEETSGAAATTAPTTTTTVKEVSAEQPATTVLPPVIETATQEEVKKEKDIATDIPPLPLSSPVARTLDFEIPFITSSTTAVVLPERLETPVIGTSSSQPTTSASSSSTILEPLNSCLSDENFEALKAQLLRLVSNDMSIESCLQSCSYGTPITPTKVGFEDTIECLKLLSKVSLIQFQDKILQMGLKECLNVLQASNKFSNSLLDELDENVESVFIQQGILASTLQFQERLLVEQRNIHKAQEDMHYWILQQSTLESKRNALLEEKRFYETKLREIDEKLKNTQTQLSKTDSKIKEFSPILQEATISNTTINRHRSALSKVVIDSNTVLTKFRDVIVNNF